MKLQRKRMLAMAAGVVLWAALSQSATVADPAGADGRQDQPSQALSGDNLVDVRVETGDPARTEVVLRGDAEMEFESFVLDGPDRLVVDLVGVVNRLDTYRFGVDHGGVTRVRAAQHELDPRPITRVVFDLAEPLAYEITRDGAQVVVGFASTHDVITLGGPPAPAPAPDAVAVVDETPELIELEDTSEIASLIAELEGRKSLEPTAVADDSRDVDPALIDELMQAPALASPAPSPQAEAASVGGAFETRTIVTDQVIYSGAPVSLNLVDADIKQVFRLFHEISGLNFVLDPSVTGRVTIVLDRVPWDQALDIILKNNGLDKVLENNVVRIASTQKLAQEAASRKQLKEAKELEVEPITITRTLSYGKAKDVERVIRESGVLTTRGKVIVDERTNTVIISDIPKKVAPLDELISTLDAETPQVMIEARIVETSRDFVQDLGIVWGFSALADASVGTSTGLSFPHNASVKYGLNLPGDGGASSLAFRLGNVIDSFTLDVALNTLETEGTARVISAPKVATQNNERAEIEQGVRIPIVNTTATEINVEFVSASLKMVVTPQITAEGTIILDVQVENNSPDFVNTAGGIPSIRTQRAQTKVLINDGGTTVIGGIFSVNEGQERNRRAVVPQDPRPGLVVQGPEHHTAESRAADLHHAEDHEARLIWSRACVEEPCCA